MDALKQWIICIIFCSVTAAAVSILTPDSSVQKIMKTVVATFLICAFLSPVISGVRINLKEDIPDFSSYQSELAKDITDTMLKEAEESAVTETKELLESIDVEYDEIAVLVSVNQENCIFIEKIKITLDEKYKHREKQITSNLKTMFSAEAEYIWQKN